MNSHRCTQTRHMQLSTLTENFAVVGNHVRIGLSIGLIGSAELTSDGTACGSGRNGPP